MASKLHRGDRVRILSGTRAGRTGKLTRRHGGEGFAGYWCIWMDGTDWDAPGFAAPESNLARIEPLNACPDCGERYDGEGYYCPACDQLGDWRDADR